MSMMLGFGLMLGAQRPGVAGPPAESYTFASPEAQALVARMSAQTDDYKALIDDFYVETAHILPTLDQVWFAWGTQSDSLLNWIAGKPDLTTGGAVDFVAYRGFKGNGSTSYLNSNLLMSAGTNAQRDSHCFGGGIQDTNGTANANRVLFGTNSTIATASNMQIRANGGGSAQVATKSAASGSQTTTSPVTNSIWGITRESGTGYRRYKDNAIQTANVPSASVTTVPTAESLVPPYYLAANDHITTPGALFQPGVHRQSFGFWGGALSESLYFEFVQAANRLLAAIGAMEDWGIPAPDIQPQGEFTIGTNMAGLEFGDGLIRGSDYAPIPASTLDYFNTKKLGLIRIPFKWGRMQPTLFGPLSASYLADVNTLIDGCIIRGMLPMPDMHNYGGYNDGADPEVHGKLGTADVPITALVDVWEKLSDVWVSKAIHGYDIMNEPNGLATNDLWREAAQAVITALRARGDNTRIYVEGHGWSSAYQWVANNPTLHTLTDPADDLVFSAHAYPDRDNSGSHFNWDEEVAAGDVLSGLPLDENILVRRYTPFRDWLVLHGFTGHIGETGVSHRDPEWLTVLDNGIDFLQDNNIEFTYWGSGPAWGPNYAQHLHQYNGQDPRQMVVMTKYSGYTVQPSVYFLSGPTRAVSGVASANFTVDYRGLISSTVTITPSDGGAGGTFTPTSLEFPAGYNGLGTFTYTPPGEDNYSISVTSDNDWTDPAALPVSSISDAFIATGDPQSAFALYKTYSPYTGNCVRLWRDSDNAQANFGFGADGWVDREAIRAWAPAESLRLITWFSQSPGVRDMRTVYANNNVGVSTPRDYPIFLLDAGDGYPAIRWNSDRMDLPSPMSNETRLAFMANVKYVVSGPLYWSVFGGNGVQFHDSAGQFRVEGETPITGGIITNEWHVYSARWRALQASGMQTWRDGVEIASQDSVVASYTLNSANQAQMGWFRWWATPRGSYYLRDLVVFDREVSDVDLEGIRAVIVDKYSTPLPVLDDEEDATIPAMVGQPTLRTNLKGVNMSGAENGNINSVVNYDYTFPSVAQMNYHAGKGFGVIRLPFDGSRVYHRANYALNRSEITRIKNVVQHLRGHGVRVILEPHEYGQVHDSDNGVQLPIGVTPRSTELFADMWARLTHTFKDQDNVIFNIMNEPSKPGQTATIWRDAALVAIQAIRDEGYGGIIQIPGIGYTAAHQWISNGNGAAWSGVVLPAGGDYQYEVHNYPDSNNSGTSAVCATNSYPNRFIAFTDWCRAEGVKGFLGEFARSQDASCTNHLIAALDYLTANSDVWEGWCYWTSGLWYPQSYIYSIDPASYTSPVDKPQMTELLAYL